LGIHARVKIPNRPNLAGYWLHFFAETDQSRLNSLAQKNMSTFPLRPSLLRPKFAFFRSLVKRHKEFKF
jgi:hypothetical protein